MPKQNCKKEFNKNKLLDYLKGITTFPKNVEFPGSVITFAEDLVEAIEKGKFDTPRVL